MNVLKAAIVGLALISANTLVRADVIADWNNTAMDVMKAVNVAGNPWTRSMALVNVSMSDAVNSVQNRYSRYMPELPIDPNASAEAAAAAAAREILMRQYPGQKERIDAAFAETMQTIPDNPARVAGIDLGEKVAAAIYAERQSDATNMPDTYRPLTTPGVWVPTMPPLFPQYATAKPWHRHLVGRPRRAGQLVDLLDGEPSHVVRVEQDDPVGVVGPCGRPLVTAAGSAARAARSRSRPGRGRRSCRARCASGGGTRSRILLGHGRPPLYERRRPCGVLAAPAKGWDAGPAMTNLTNPVHPPRELTISSASNPRLKGLLGLRRRRTREETGQTLVEGYEEIGLALSAGVRPGTVYVCEELFSPAGRAGSQDIGHQTDLLARLRDDRVEVVHLSRQRLREGQLPRGTRRPHRRRRPRRRRTSPTCTSTGPTTSPCSARASRSPATSAPCSAPPTPPGSTPSSRPTPSPTGATPTSCARARAPSSPCPPRARRPPRRSTGWRPRHPPRRRRPPRPTCSTPTSTTPVASRSPSAARSTAPTATLLEAATHRVRIPMHGKANSLNVAASAAIVLYEAVRQRDRADRRASAGRHTR